MFTSMHLVYVAEYAIATRREKTNISDAQGRTVSQCEIPLGKVDSAILQWISSFVIGKQIESHLFTLSCSKFNLIHQISAIQLNLSKPNLLGSYFFVQTGQVFGLYWLY